MCFKKSSLIPTESIILTLSPPSRLGSELQRRKKQKDEAFLRRDVHAKHLLCASNLSKNNHKLACCADVKHPCHAVTGIVYIRVLTLGEICIFNEHRSKQSFHTDMIQTHSNHCSTASSAANPLNLSIGDCSRMAVSLLF